MTQHSRPVLVAVALGLSASTLLPSETVQARQSRASAEAMASRVGDRIASLQREAETLAGQSRTLVGELRKLEVERDLQTERLRNAQAEAATAQATLLETTQKLTELEEERLAQIPDVRAQLVDVYKRRVGGYARLILEAEDVRDLGRVARAVAAMSRISSDRITEHQQTLEKLTAEQTALGKTAVELAASEAEARRARVAAERAIAARTALIAQIDARRDLNAQLSGELQVANDRLRRRVADLAEGRTAERVTVPLVPFKGSLDWPVAGPVSGRFGQPASRIEGAPVRSGIEIAAPLGSAVRAVHGGTVAFSDSFTGFSNLVIIDHGSQAFSVYGHLGSASVKRGDVLDVGSEVGRVGTTPGGPSALYFEMRIDDRSVDPLEWLAPR